MIYGIFSGCYSDWQVHGYFENKDDAEKYCAYKNSNKNEDDYYSDDYYVKSLELIDINNDIKSIKLNYYHEVVFDFNRGMRKEPDRYEYYMGNNRPSRVRYNVFNDNNGWICFSFNCETRAKAEKIAQDKYAEYLHYYTETGNYHEAAKFISAVRV